MSVTSRRTRPTLQALRATTHNRRPRTDELRDGDIALFTLSKLTGAHRNCLSRCRLFAQRVIVVSLTTRQPPLPTTGHAGTRIGWALTRDAAVARRLKAFISAAGELPRENQLRALAVLSHLANEGAGGAMLAEVRWCYCRARFFCGGRISGWRVLRH